MTFNGILPVDKPEGPTSHDIVSRARRALRIRKVGHTGTLDPFASGLLLLCLGPSTRLAEYFSPLSKSYVATMRIGISTDTDDRTGSVLKATDEWTGVSHAVMVEALARQCGELQQIPPDYSAKRVDGKRMYDVARSGGEVRLGASAVRVERIELVGFEPPYAIFEVDCSTGTYIRAIARDIGEDLGVGAHLTALRRTGIGAFSVDRALDLDQVEDPGDAADFLVEPARAVAHLGQVTLTQPECDAVKHGGAVARSTEGGAGPIALLSPEGDLVAIANAADGQLRPRKVFA